MTTFIVVLVLLFMLGGAVAGWMVHQRWHEARDRELRAREAVLDERRRELEQLQRVHAAFWRARQLMRDEAIRARRGTHRDIT